MKSTIRVDFAGLDNQANGFEPVIRVNLQDSEDVRDGLLKSFFEALGHQSNLLKVNFQSDTIDGIKQPKRITLYPVKPEELIIVDSSGSHDILVTDVVPHREDTDLINSSYCFKTTKSLKGLREGILKEAIERVINNPGNWIE